MLGKRYFYDLPTKINHKDFRIQPNQKPIAKRHNPSDAGFRIIFLKINQWGKVWYMQDVSAHAKRFTQGRMTILIQKTFILLEKNIISGIDELIASIYT